MQIPFVGFLPVRSSEHVAAIGMFVLLQLRGLVEFARSNMTVEAQQRVFRYLLFSLLTLSVVLLAVLRFLGYITKWTGRFYSLLDPTYAKEHIPIIASVSEHQPTTWGSYFFDLQLMTFFIPAGLYVCFRRLNDANMFIILYGIFSVYFSGVMVRLMLVLAPVACVLSAIAVTHTYETYLGVLLSAAKEDQSSQDAKKKKESADSDPLFQRTFSVVVLLGLTFFLCSYTVHSTWVTSEAYSSPSIVLSARGHDGGKIIFDDFREAYYWLRHNTPEDSKVMSWWDYGYQIIAMANRTILVDNNTWNNTHIATVGRAMASTEEVAYPVMRSLDVDYVLVLFGGMVGYSSDDINKFLWMVRIGGGVFPDVVEKEYMSAKGEYRIDREASPRMLNCMMYKMCYYRFGTVQTDYSQPSGFDRVRNVEIGNKDFELEYIEEAFTSEHWLVRIYAVSSYIL